MAAHQGERLYGTENDNCKKVYSWFWLWYDIVCEDKEDLTVNNSTNSNLLSNSTNNLLSNSTTSALHSEHTYDHSLCMILLLLTVVCLIGLYVLVQFVGKKRRERRIERYV